MTSRTALRLLAPLGIAAVLLSGCGAETPSGESSSSSSTASSSSASESASSGAVPEATSNLAVDRAAAASKELVGEGAQILGAAKMKQALQAQAAGTNGATSEPAECLTIQSKALGSMPSGMSLAAAVGQQGTLTVFEDASRKYPQLQKQAYADLDAKCKDFTLKAAGQTLRQHVEQFTPEGLQGDVVFGSSVTTQNEQGQKSAQTAVGYFRDGIGASGTVIGSDDAARQKATDLAKAGMKAIEDAKR